MTDALSAAPLRRTLIVGGVLLIASAVMMFAQTTYNSTALWIALMWLGTAGFSAALLVFAFGVGRAGSIVGRRPLAVSAAVVVAVWPFLDRALTWLMPYESTPGFYQPWGYISLAVKLAALIVFVVQVARAGVLRGRVRWMPLWGLVLVAAPQILAQLLFVALDAAESIARSSDEDEWIALIWGLGQLMSFAVPVALGVTALVVANRPTPVGDPVQVYPPAA